MGLKAPAEDCLLKPADVAKWSADAPKTKGDLWTRGSLALPVYNEEEHRNELPEYVKDPEPVAALDVAPSDPTVRQSSFTADGKTTQQIIEEAKAKSAVPLTRKEKLKKSWSAGINMTMGM